MARRTTFSVLTLCTLWFTACADNSTSTPSVQGIATDTLGKQFTVGCDSSLCTLTPVDPSLNPAAKQGPMSCSSGYGTDAFILLLGRVLTVHLAVQPSYGPLELSSAEPAHPLVCATDADCAIGNVAPSNYRYAYLCLNRICQDPRVELAAHDVIALCQADIPWPTTCPYITSPRFAARLNEIARLCGGEPNCLKIPVDCWQLAAAVDAGVAPVGTVEDAGASSEAGVVVFDSMLAL